MRRRCMNQRCREYPRYGGRGITVCERWNISFAAFFADIGPRPSSQHSLDRYPDNDGNYEMGNVRWATKSEQARNRHSSRLITWQGETLTLAAWSERTRLKAGTIAQRLKKGWAIDRALTEKPMSAREASYLGTRAMLARHRVIIWQGDCHTLPELSLRTGVKAQTIWNRLKIGMSIGAALRGRRAQ